MNPIRRLSVALTLLAASATVSAADTPAVAPTPAASPVAAIAVVKAIAIGSSAPMRDTRMKNVTDKQITIASAAGKKGTLVFFICNHCPYVKAWQGRIAAIGNAAITEGVGVIAINSNDPSAYAEDSFAEMQTRAAEVGYKFPYVMDATSDVARAFGATHTPEAFLFDANGKLVYHGGVDDNGQDEKSVKHAWLKDAVDALAAGKAVPVAETKALGCGVKFREKTSS